MPITDSQISKTLAMYLDAHPDETPSLAEPLHILTQGEGFASGLNFRMHATASALLVREPGEILLIEHLAYGILLQPGG